MFELFEEAFWLELKWSWVIYDTLLPALLLLPWAPTVLNYEKRKEMKENFPNEKFLFFKNTKSRNEQQQALHKYCASLLLSFCFPGTHSNLWWWWSSNFEFPQKRLELLFENNGIEKKGKARNFQSRRFLIRINSVQRYITPSMLLSEESPLQVQHGEILINVNKHVESLITCLGDA